MLASLPLLAISNSVGASGVSVGVEAVAGQGASASAWRDNSTLA